MSHDQIHLEPTCPNVVYSQSFLQAFRNQKFRPEKVGQVWEHFPYDFPQPTAKRFAGFSGRFLLSSFHNK